MHGYKYIKQKYAWWKMPIFSQQKKNAKPMSNFKQTSIYIGNAKLYQGQSPYWTTDLLGKMRIKVCMSQFPRSTQTTHEKHRPSTI